MKFEDRTTALPADVLMRVDKPARYIGGEPGSVMKDEKDVKVRFVMCFPDVYEIGMSHIGMQILYGMFNSYEDIWCERLFSPWSDLDKIMRDENIPLFSLESGKPVKDADFLGFTLQYEMCYTNILQILDLSKIPFYSKDRTEADPIVIGGGPCVYNPEPIADFFDMFYIGEGEVRYRELMDLYEEYKEKGRSREDFLRAASHVPGIYVPSLYDVSYDKNGRFTGMTPKYEDVPARVEKQLVKDMNEAFYQTNPVVPFIRATQDRAVIEVQRGCIRGCRFCQAGQIYKPVRERSAENLLKQAQTILKNTGYEELSLSSLSTSDHRELKVLLETLIGYCNENKVNISLPSLRIDAFSLDVMDKVQDVKKSSLTFAPEAGSQRMRNVINKGLTIDDILNGSRLAFKGGWNKVKLYFMLGLPFEREEDAVAIADLCNEVAKVYFDTVPKEERHGSVQITASSSFFVPKPFTAFQWARMNTPDEFIAKAKITKQAVRNELNQKRISYHYHDCGTTIIEGIFARGDRKLSASIEYAYNHGAVFDAWTETFSYEGWMTAFKETSVDYEDYIYRVRDDDEAFPWDFIDCGVRKEYLLNEWKKAAEASVTPNCREKCAGCGCAVYGCGVCTEKRS